MKKVFIKPAFGRHYLVLPWGPESGIRKYVSLGTWFTPFIIKFVRIFRKNSTRSLRWITEQKTLDHWVLLTSQFQPTDLLKGWNVLELRSSSKNRSRNCKMNIHFILWNSAGRERSLLFVPGSQSEHMGRVLWPWPSADVVGSFSSLKRGTKSIPHRFKK